MSCQDSLFIDFACSSVICAMLPDNDNNFCSIDLSTVRSLNSVYVRAHDHVPCSFVYSKYPVCDHEVTLASLFFTVRAFSTLPIFAR